MDRRASGRTSCSTTASGSAASASSASCARPACRGCRSRSTKATTIRVPGVRVCEDLVDRDFAAGAPNRCWVADITYPRTWEGWLYLVAVQDIYSRRIVGWTMADHMRSELVTDALQMALADRRPAPGLIWHSDQGSQGGFTRSSQHLQVRSCDGPAGWLDEGAHGSLGDEVAGQAVASTRGRAVVLAGDREGPQQRRRRCRGGGLVSGWRPVVSRAWRDGDSPARPGLVPLSVLCRARGDCSAARRGQGRQGNRA